MNSCKPEYEKKKLIKLILKASMIITVILQKLKFLIEVCSNLLKA